MVPFLPGSVLHGGTPGDYDPQAALTGGLLGIAIFFVFVLGATVWTLVKRYWMHTKTSEEAQASSQEPLGEDDAKIPTTRRSPPQSNVLLVEIPSDEGSPYPPVPLDDEEQGSS